MKTVNAWFDGACLGNPGGHGSYGALVEVDREVVWKDFRYLGYQRMTNNVAEYCGAISVLKFLQEQDFEEVTIHGDSKLVIEQLAGRWKAKSGVYVKQYLEAKELVYQLKKRMSVNFQWIPRLQNERADHLADLALSEHLGIEIVHHYQRFLK